MFRIMYSPIQRKRRSCDLTNNDAVEVIVGRYQRDDLVSPPDDGPFRHAQERADPLARHVVDIGQLKDGSEPRLVNVQCLDDNHHEIQRRIDMQDAVPHPLPLVRPGRKLSKCRLALASN